MRAVLKVVILAILISLGVAQSAYATQYSPPWAHLNAVPDVYQLIWGESWLDSAGYNCYSSTGLSSYGWWSHMKSDALTISDSHAAPGMIEASDGSRLLAEGGSNGGSFWYLSSMSSTDIADLLLFMPIGCNTSGTDYKYGNLLDQARAKGADIAIGWSTAVCNEPSAIFGMGFCRGASTTTRPVDSPVARNSGTDVDLMQYADDYMWANSSAPYEYKEAMRGWITKGMYGQVLKPARYGSW